MGDIMNSKKKSKSSDQSELLKDSTSEMDEVRNRIIIECKRLATFKVSSAIHIIEATKKLLRLESESLK